MSSGTRFFREVIELAEVDSTNRYALELGRPGVAVTACCQTGGRGRRGRKWFSSEGQNLYLSVTPGRPQTTYPILAGVAVREALASLLERPDLMIKWPNDILADRRKLCGILCESRANVTVIGIGVNVNQWQWPDEIAGIAVSMAQLAGRDFELTTVRDTILASLEKWIASWQLEGFGKIRETFLDHSYARNQPALLEDGTACLIVDMDREGCLVVAVEGERQTILSGEVVLTGFKRS